MHALNRRSWRTLLQLCPELEELKEKVATVVGADGA